ncbi:MAG: hypothetical protein NTU69_10275 [Proteobacteria bacterium]|nr:hypothetical protein [Pseudomonadota bacterium]
MGRVRMPAQGFMPLEKNERYLCSRGKDEKDPFWESPCYGLKKTSS